jgi:hypothetical protein
MLVGGTGTEQRVRRKAASWLRFGADGRAKRSVVKRAIYNVAEQKEENIEILASEGTLSGTSL